LLQAGMISLEEALNNATNPDEFRMRVSGIYSRDQQTGNANAPAKQEEKEETIFVKH